MRRRSCASISPTRGRCITFRVKLATTACSTAPASARKSRRASANSLRRLKRASANAQRCARPSRPGHERNAALAPRLLCSQYSEAASRPGDERDATLSSRLLCSQYSEAAYDPQPTFGRNCKMSDWKVLYRDDLDRDRTSRSIPSQEDALRQARNLFIDQRAELYRIEGPNGQTLPKQVIMRWVSANKW